MGVGGVLDSVKNKFENKEDDQPIPISRGVPLVKKEMAAAKTFEQIELKKKDKEQLHQELNKTDEDVNDPKPEKKLSSRAKKAADRQRELLEDIHALNSRLSKKNALKEHETKMEEYSKFMDEIQDYLVEPDQCNEESTFKDDIK